MPAPLLEEFPPRIVLHDTLHPYEGRADLNVPPRPSLPVWEPDPDDLRCKAYPFDLLTHIGMGFDLLPPDGLTNTNILGSIYVRDVQSRAAQYRGHKKVGRYGFIMTCRDFGTYVRCWRSG